MAQRESMENAFQEIEDKAPRIIKKIEVFATGKKIPLKDEEREILSFFTAIQLFRVPNFRHGVEEMHRKIVEISLSQMVENDKKKGELPPEVEKFYARGDIKVEIEPFVSLEHMVNLAQEGANRLLNRVWHFAAPGDGIKFVTSDNPVYFQAPEEYRAHTKYGIGPLHPYAELTIPLKKNLLLIICPAIKYKPDQFELMNCTTVLLDRADTKNINKRTTMAAERFVYASEWSEGLARMVAKYKGTSQKLRV